MATTSGIGMFGPTMAQARADYFKRMQAQYANETNPYSKMGMALGNIIGTALGVKDPMLEQASKVQSVYNSVAQMYTDQTSPEFYKELANVFSAAGMNEQAVISAEKAKEVEYKQAELGMKKAKTERELRESAQKNIKFYKENPDQAEFRIAELAEIIKTDPGNETALQEYNQIARAASEGAIEATGKAEKETVDLAKNKAQLAKYNRELKDAEKFGPAERWDAEREAAIALLKVNNINPTDDLDQKTTMLNPEIVQAQKLALRTPLGTKQQQTPAYGTNQPTPTPQPAPATARGSSNVEASVKAAGLSYEPDKYEYRVLANGTVQRKKK